MSKSEAEKKEREEDRKEEDAVMESLRDRMLRKLDNKAFFINTVVH